MQEKWDSFQNKLLKILSGMLFFRNNVATWKFQLHSLKKLELNMTKCIDLKVYAEKNHDCKIFVTFSEEQ